MISGRQQSLEHIEEFGIVVYHQYLICIFACLFVGIGGGVCWLRHVCIVYECHLGCGHGYGVYFVNLLFFVCLFVDRQGDEKCGAYAFMALTFYLAVVQRHEVAGYGQAEPVACGVVLAVVAIIEMLIEMLELVAIHSRPGIFHLYIYLVEALVGGGREPYLAIGRGILGGI